MSFWFIPKAETLLPEKSALEMEGGNGVCLFNVRFPITRVRVLSPSADENSKYPLSPLRLIARIKMTLNNWVACCRCWLNLLILYYIYKLAWLAWLSGKDDLNKAVEYLPVWRANILWKQTRTLLLSREALCGQGKRRIEELAESIKMTAWQLFDT